MSDTQRTPGKWEYNSRLETIDAEGCRLGIIAHLDENGEGNGPLMAAAPDMLKELQSSRKMLGILCATQPGIRSATTKDMLDGMDAAIAKATKGGK